MSESLPEVYLARHGETDWTVSGRHTGRTDVPLTGRGERNAANLRDRLGGMTFAQVLVSPRARAVRTCELTGFGDVAEVIADLAEWDYGTYEGRTTAAPCPPTPKEKGRGSPRGAAPFSPSPKAGGSKRVEKGRPSLGVWTHHDAATPAT